MCSSDLTDIWEKMKRGDKDLPADALGLVTGRAIRGEYSVGSMNKPTKVVLNGDLWALFNGGGGGYGDVLERDPDLVVEDLRREVISHRTAETVYRVAYNHETLDVDYNQTGELRHREREDRKARGVRWADFEKEWAQMKPVEEALEYYGSWPDAKKTREIIRM